MTGSQDVGALLRQALLAKSAERGRKYTYRDLSDDSGVDYSYVSKVLKKRSQPSREIIAAWSRALHPHFPLDDALLAAGFAPQDPDKLSLFRRLIRLTADQWGEIEARVGEFAADLTPEQRAQLAAEREAERATRQRRRRTPQQNPPTKSADGRQQGDG